MEALWNELSRDEVQLESPAWHGSVLAETEKRLAEGTEQVMDWERSKRDLLNKKV